MDVGAEDILGMVDGRIASVAAKIDVVLGVVILGLGSIFKISRERH